MSDNVLKLATPTLYRCQVYRYFSGLSRLYLSVFKPNQTVPAFYVLFSDVAYFEGPMGWESAAFYTEDKDTCVDLLLRTGIIGPAILQFPDAYAPITETVRLYTVDSAHSQIKIVASSIARLESVPADI